MYAQDLLGSSHDQLRGIALYILGSDKNNPFSFSDWMFARNGQLVHRAELRADGLESDQYGKECFASSGFVYDNSTNAKHSKLTGTFFGFPTVFDVGSYGPTLLPPPISDATGYSFLH